MGTFYCIQYCKKNEEEKNKKTKESTQKINQFFSSYSSFQQNNYINYSKKFNSKMHYLGKYFDISEFNRIIPKNAYNYMIQNVLNIPSDIVPKRAVYEMKPVQFENGNIYSGNWSEKYKMDGYGQYYIKEANLFVEGIWEEGKLIYGRIFFPNENIYEGGIKNSSFNGKGKLIFNNGDIYIGDFLDGERTGKGKYLFSDGTVYEGELLNSEFKGHGIMIWVNGIEYEGNFNGLILTGIGKLRDHNSGDIYEGNFDNNYFNRYGIYYYSNFGSYEGEFDFGIKQGRGTYKNKNGIIYEGEWNNDLPDGIGKFKCKEYIVKGVWKKGKNLEITDLIKGSMHNFDKKILNFKIPKFNLYPQLLSNLAFGDISEIKKSEEDIRAELF